MAKNVKIFQGRESGSLLVEVLIASLILVLVGITFINSISTSNILAKNSGDRIQGFLALNAASEILEKTPYQFCTSNIAIPNNYQTVINNFNSTISPSQGKVGIESVYLIAKTEVTANRTISSGTFSGGLITFVSTSPLPSWLTPNQSKVSITGNSNSGFNISNTFIKSVANNSFSVESNGVSGNFDNVNLTTATFMTNTGYTKCGSSISAYESVNKFKEMEWAIQKIDLIYTGINETLKKTIIKNFDGRNQSYATAKVALGGSPSTSLSTSNLNACGNPQITTSNITLQTGETKTFNLSINPSPASGTVLFTIGNLDVYPLATTVNSSISGNILTLTAPEFAPTPIRNQPGKVNLEIEAINIDNGSKYLPAGLGITVNSLKVVDASTNLSLNENSSITSRTFANGIKVDSIVPELVSGGCPPYTFTASPALPFGLQLTSDKGSISGITCDNSSNSTYNFSVTDTGNLNRATNLISLAVTGRAIAPLPTLLQTNQTYKFTFSKSVASYNQPITKLCNPPSGSPTYYSVDASGSALALPNGLSLNATTGNVTGKPTGSTSSGKNIWIKVCFGTCTVSNSYTTSVPIFLEVVA